jgi:hypothetical protein
MQNVTIPEDVEKTPAGPGGNGFVILDMQADSMVGSDGEIYVRQNGVVSLAPEVE